jgi:hypothetical protein
MPIKSLSNSSLLNFQKYSSVLAGNEAFIPINGAFDLLESTILTTGVSSFTFSGLDAYAADYKHLQIRHVSNLLGGPYQARMTLNGDTSPSYSIHTLETGSSSVASYGQNSSTYMLFGDRGNTGPTPVVTDLLDFSNTNKFKTIKLAFGNTGWRTAFQSGGYRSLSVINSITMYVTSGGIEPAGTRYSLYGIKG